MTKNYKDKTDTWLEKGDRIAKVLARAGVSSRREAESLILEGRITVDGKTLDSPAFKVDGTEDIRVDGTRIPVREKPRLWRYHKPAGLVTTHKDPEGRQTVFDHLQGLPRVISVGRLDINTEGLILLTNDGGLARELELPSRGWIRRYRVRAFGRIEQQALDGLKSGPTIDGVTYGPVEAKLERQQGDNVWLTVAIKEGKNREIKRVLEHVGMRVNRLIRTSFGPFQLGSLKSRSVEEIPAKTLKEQLGTEMRQKLGF